MLNRLLRERAREHTREHTRELVFGLAIIVGFVVAGAVAIAFMRYAMPALGTFLVTTPSEPVRVAMTLLFASTIFAVGVIFASVTYAAARWMDLQAKLMQSDIERQRVEVWGEAIDEAVERAR